jgi:hypothetical protein
MKKRRRERPRVSPPVVVIKRLAHFFHRNGYVRWQNEVRLAEEGWAVYKKGHEVRLVAKSKKELTVIRDLLIRAGFEPGRPFIKGQQLRQPIYGKKVVAHFLQLVGGD